MNPIRLALIRSWLRCYFLFLWYNIIDLLFSISTFNFTSDLFSDFSFPHFKKRRTNFKRVRIYSLKQSLGVKRGNRQWSSSSWTLPSSFLHIFQFIDIIIVWILSKCFLFFSCFVSIQKYSQQIVRLFCVWSDSSCVIHHSLIRWRSIKLLSFIVHYCSAARYSFLPIIATPVPLCRDCLELKVLIPRFW